MSIFDFQLASNDRVCGTVYLPDDSTTPLPVVVYCHGWGGSRSLPPVVASLWRLLESEPAALVAVDFFGCGQTGGDYGQMSYGRWHTNLAEVFDWIMRQPWADPQRIGCFAISSGTTAAFRHGIASPDCAFIVSVATCIGAFIGMPNPPGRIFAENARALLEGKTASVFGTAFSQEFFHDFLTEAPVYRLRSIVCPVFFLQGADDNPWRRADAWLGFQLLKEQGAKYMEIPGGDHGLDRVADIAAGAAMEWLREINFRRSATPNSSG